MDAAVKALAKAQEGLEKVQPDPSEPDPSQPEPPKRPFVDVDQTSGYWYYDAVYYNYDNGIIEGVDTTHFDPLNDVVRGQFAIMLYRVEGKPAVSFADRFVDVAKNDWFADAVIWANKAEVVTGYTDGSGKFGPTDPILREQGVSIVHIHPICLLSPVYYLIYDPVLLRAASAQINPRSFNALMSQQVG